MATNTLTPHQRSIRVSDKDLKRFESLIESLDFDGATLIRMALKWVATQDEGMRYTEDEPLAHSRIVRLSDKDLKALESVMSRGRLSDGQALRYALRRFAQFHTKGNDDGGNGM